MNVPDHTYRRLSCGHQERWKRFESTIDPLWCPDCEDTVPLEFYEGPLNPNARPVTEGDKRLPICDDYIITKWAIEGHRDGPRSAVAIDPNQPWGGVAV